MSTSLQSQQPLLLTRLIRVQRKKQRDRRRPATPSISSLSSYGAAAHSLLPSFAFYQPELSVDNGDSSISACVFPTSSNDFLVRVSSGDGVVSVLQLEWPQRTATHALSVCVSAFPLAVYVTASDSYVYRVDLQPLLYRNRLPHVVSSAIQHTLQMPSLAETALRVSEKLSADRVLEFTDKAVLVPMPTDQPPLCSACTYTGSVVVFGLGGGFVHIVNIEDSRTQTVSCGSRDIVKVELMATTINTSNVGLLDVQLLVATCELGTIHMCPLSVCEGGVEWWIFDARQSITWFVPDCQSGSQIVQIVHDLGKTIEHSMAFPAVTDVETVESSSLHVPELPEEGASVRYVGAAGWLLVVSRHSGNGSLFDVRECMTHWLRHDIDIDIGGFASATCVQHGAKPDTVQVNEQLWKPVAHIDLKAALHLSPSTDIVSVTEVERTLCVSYTTQDDTRSGSAELIVASVSPASAGQCLWQVQSRLPFLRSDTPLAAVKVGGRWTSSSSGAMSRVGVIFYSLHSVLYLSRRTGSQQSRWLQEDPTKVAATGKLDDAINLAVTQLHYDDQLPGKHDLLLHVAVWIIELAKTDTQLPLRTLLRQVLTEIDRDDFCALLPSLIGGAAGQLDDVMVVAIERRCVSELLSSLSSQAVTSLNLYQTNQLIASGYTNELALHSDGLLFKRLGTSAQLCVLLSSRRTFNRCHQRVLEMLPSLNHDLLQCVIWVLMNWAAPSTADQSALEADSPAMVASLGILKYVRAEWSRKRSLVSAFQAEASEASIPEPVGWTACELEVGITCWLVILVQKCGVVNDYKALIRGGMTAARRLRPCEADTEQPFEVSHTMAQILHHNASSVEKLQEVLMKLMTSAHRRCNPFLLLGRCIDLHNFPAAALVLELCGRKTAALSMHLRVVHLMACFGSSIEENEPSPMVNKKRNFWHRVDAIVNETEWLASGRISMHQTQLSEEVEASLVSYLLGLIQHLVFSSQDTQESDVMLAHILCVWSGLRLPIESLDHFLREAVTRKQPSFDICRLVHTVIFSSPSSQQSELTDATVQAEAIHRLAFTPDFYLDIASAVVNKNTRQ